VHVVVRAEGKEFFLCFASFSAGDGHGFLAFEDIEEVEFLSDEVAQFVLVEGAREDAESEDEECD
jgi:hypothetical protein